MAGSTAVAETLMDRHGQTYAEEAGINLKNTPSPLYRLLVLSVLLSARIRADVAVAAARELSAAGLRSARTMDHSTWRDRMKALGRGRYRRFDDRTATMLGDGARLVLDAWGGDLRTIRDDDPERVREQLMRVPGIGPTGADIFCREVQGVWPELEPYVDTKVVDGAERLGLPTTPGWLARLAEPEELPHLVAGCVRAGLSRQVADDVMEHV